MNIRLIIQILLAMIFIEFIAIIYQTRVYKQELNKSIEYEKCREEVLAKAEKEREEIRTAMKKQKVLKERLEELNKKREQIKK